MRFPFWSYHLGWRRGSGWSEWTCWAPPGTPAGGSRSFLGRGPPHPPPPCFCLLLRKTAPAHCTVFELKKTKNKNLRNIKCPPGSFLCPPQGDLSISTSLLLSCIKSRNWCSYLFVFPEPVLSLAQESDWTFH